MPSSTASASICSVFALERQIIVGNGDSEVLGHLVVIDHGPDRERDWPAAKIEALRCVLRDEAVAPVDQQALMLAQPAACIQLWLG